MTQVNNGQLASTLSNVQKKFVTEFNRLDPLQGYQNLITILPSDTETEEMAWYGSTPLMQDVTKGQVEFGGAEAYSYSLTSRTFQAGMSFKREWWEDDKLKFAPALIAGMAEEAQANRGREVVDLFTAGGAKGQAFDGTAFFDATRTQGESAAINNQMSHNMTLTTTLDVAEVHTVVDAALVRMAGFEDDKGNLQGKMPDTFIVPTSHFSGFWRGLASGDQSGSVPGMPPAVTSGMVQVGGYNLLVVPTLAATDTIYAARLAGAMKPFVLLERSKPEVEGITRTDSDWWLIKRRIPYIATDRFEVGFGDFRSMIEITIT
jgi:phage major head subunit gpT-like protein